MDWDFSGKHIFRFHFLSSNFEYKNNWRTNFNLAYNPFDISNTALRGGPALKKPNGYGIFVNVQSDSRKKVIGNVSIFKFRGQDGNVDGVTIGGGFSIQVLDRLSIKLNASFNSNFRKQDQYVDQLYFGNEKRYIVAGLDQKTLSLTGRLNLNITPDLTLQYYGQPFITRPLYHNYAYVSDPLNDDYDSRFTVYAKDELIENGNTLLVDENKDGAIDYQFSKADFNFVQFRSNLVLRYEYLPGSEAYLVWNQSNSPNAFNDFDTSLSHSLFDNAFSNGSNIFLVKFTYRLLR
jgi:hypothetical protein